MSLVLALVVYHTLIYGGQPFGNDPHSWNHYIKRNENLDLTGLMVPNMGQAIQLLTLMLDPDPTNRPKDEEVLDQPFFKGTPAIRHTKQRVSQLTRQMYRYLARKRMPQMAPIHQAYSLLPGVQETSEELSRGISRLINEGPLELKQKVPGTPPIQATRDQISQLAHQTYMSLTRGNMPGIVQQHVEDLLPGVWETSEQLSEDVSRLINEGPLELKPKVQASRSSPTASGTATELARTLSGYFEANHLKMTLSPVSPVDNGMM